MEKLLIWNINQRAGYGKPFYPKLVLNSFDTELDIIIFTEFYKQSDWENTFSNDKYLFETSNNGDNHNEILIAYNREKYSKIGDKYTWKSDYDKDSPDYLDICLKDNFGNIFVVVGTRILVNYYDYNDANTLNKEMEARARQGKKFINRINTLLKKYKIIGGGDFNVGRRNNQNEYWSKSVFEGYLSDKINIVMPEGVSHQVYKGTEYAGCPDLIFYSNEIDVDVYPYNWNFVKDCKDIYVDGKFTKEIPAPYPDHAQIIANFNFNKNC